MGEVSSSQRPSGRVLEGHWTSNAADQELADWAEANDHVLLTRDLDFGATLATQGRTKPSVVQIRADSMLTADVGDMVLEAFKQYPQELEDGAIVTVDYGRSKIRALPLK